MLRTAFAATLGVLICTITILAAEYKDAKIKAVDTDKNTITFVVKKDDKEVEKTLKVTDKDLTVVNAKDKDVKDGLKNKQFSKEALEKGRMATITTKGEGKDETVTKIQLAPGKKQ